MLKDDKMSLVHTIFKQLNLHSNIEAMKDDVFDTTPNQIKSNKEFYNSENANV